MHNNQSHIRVLSLAMVLLFIGTQFGWPVWVEKGVFLQDITLSLAPDPEKGEPELLSEIERPSCEYKTAPPGSALFLGKYLQGMIHPCSLYEGLKSRPPPTLLSNYPLNLSFCS